MEQAVVRLYCVDSTCVLVNHAVSRLLRKLNRKQYMHGYPQMMSVGKLQACDLLEFILLLLGLDELCCNTTAVI